MKPLLLFAVVVTICKATTWRTFKYDFRKTYADNGEDMLRSGIFHENLNKISAHNNLYEQGKVSYFMGINKFADWTEEELAKLTSGFSAPRRANITRLPLVNLTEDLPDYVDWRDSGIVTSVKYQGDCDSCWAFSAVGAIEGQYALKTGRLVSFSEQQLIDCAEAWGCSPGWMLGAFDYVRNSGIELEKDYGYTGVEKTCQHDKSKVVTYISGYNEVDYGNEIALQHVLVKVGPVSVALDATQASFWKYARGIYDQPGCQPEKISHAALVVGYGTEKGQDYWLVKNSWGSDWGEDGYIRISRNKDNHCGIASCASYPLMN